MEKIYATASYINNNNNIINLEFNRSIDIFEITEIINNSADYNGQGFEAQIFD